MGELAALSVLHKKRRNPSTLHTYVKLNFEKLCHLWELHYFSIKFTDYFIFLKKDELQIFFNLQWGHVLINLFF